MKLLNCLYRCYKLTPVHDLEHEHPIFIYLRILLNVVFTFAGGIVGSFVTYYFITGNWLF